MYLRLGRIPGGLKAAKNITPKQGLPGNNLRAFNDALVAMNTTLERCRAPLRKEDQDS